MQRWRTTFSLQVMSTTEQEYEKLFMLPFAPLEEVLEKHRRLFGVILLILGLSVFWKTGINLLGTFLYVPEFIWRFGYTIPQIAVAFIILYFALCLMKGTKEEPMGERTEEAAEENFAEESQKEEA